MAQIAGYNTRITTANFSGTVDARVPILVAPFGGATVKNVWGISDGAISAHASNYITGTVYNGGTVGTATTAVAAGPGTATGWSADTKTAFTVTTANANLAAGEMLVIAWDYNGTVAPINLTAIVEWVQGQG